MALIHRFVFHLFSPLQRDSFPPSNCIPRTIYLYRPMSNALWAMLLQSNVWCTFVKWRSVKCTCLDAECGVVSLHLFRSVGYCLHEMKCDEMKLNRIQIQIQSIIYILCKFGESLFLTEDGSHQLSLCFVKTTRTLSDLFIAHIIVAIVPVHVLHVCGRRVGCWWLTLLPLSPPPIQVFAFSIHSTLSRLTCTPRWVDPTWSMMRITSINGPSAFFLFHETSTMLEYFFNLYSV